MREFIHSPISEFTFNDINFLVKRDDLLPNQINGNKARKLAFYLFHDFPKIDTLIGCGGNQSNLMYALSVLAKLKRWQFIYYTPQLSKGSKNSIDGNLAASINNDMQLIEVNHQEFKSLPLQIQQLILPNQLFISHDLADNHAEFGFKQLANEIKLYTTNQRIENLNLFIPSGTGISALYLQKHLPNFKVYTTNCIADKNYLAQQFKKLDEHTPPPIIFENTSFRFANPNFLLLKTIKQVQPASNIEFDLIYDPVGWKILLDNLEQISGPIMYIHCGGTLGNESMLARYRYNKLI